MGRSISPGGCRRTGLLCLKIRDMQKVETVKHLIVKFLFANALQLFQSLETVGAGETVASAHPFHCFNAVYQTETAANCCPTMT
jgi:hypothetical protein